ncbi:helix-turn-helix domain-containing protein [Streptomyces sp. NPDC023723]|uniref:ArsR/SmtB family transcription factor n=1 Tax=Streptomyces sp. NPDC023723 TaxID=3154323 RepID=UPI0033D9CF4F
MPSWETPPGQLPPVASVQKLLRALADPVRLEMVRRLATHPAAEAPCSDLYEGLTKSTATHHFKVLVEAGVLHPVMVGPSRGHRLRRTALQEAAPGLLDALMAAMAREG